MKMTTFQIGVMVVFIGLAVFGVIMFASVSGLNGGGGVGKVVIWGTVSSDTMEKTITTLRNQDKTTYQDVQYVQKDGQTYANDLVNAMANGTGPDLFIVAQDQVTIFSDKISTIPYSAISQQTFVDSYIDEAQMFLTPQGPLALPFTVDPLIMYWNRDIFSTAAIAKPPQYWNDFLDMAPLLTVLDASSNIKRSAVAMGEYQNIGHAKEILTTLMLQAGDPIVTRDTATGKPVPTLGKVRQSTTEDPATSALQFYTEFANPSKTTYSWNRALTTSQDAFVAGDLAVYFGLASDYPTIASRNPNLNFGVSVVPQIKGGALRLTYGGMMALAVPRTSPNPRGAVTVALSLSSQAGVTAVVTHSGLPPVRRDVAVDSSSNAIQTILTQSALIARSWLDPNPNATNPLFQDMIESVVSGKASPGQAIFASEQSLETLLHTNSMQTQ